jgi:hypothetical protein
MERLDEPHPWGGGAGEEVAMCPFCIGTALWIAAGAVSAGGVSALAAAKIWNKKTQNNEGGSDDRQSGEQTAAQ